LSLIAASRYIYERLDDLNVYAYKFREDAHFRGGRCHSRTSTEAELGAEAEMQGFMGITAPQEEAVVERA